MSHCREARSSRGGSPWAAATSSRKPRHASAAPSRAAPRSAAVTAAYSTYLAERKAGAPGWPVGASPGDLVRVGGGSRPEVWYGVGVDGALRRLPTDPWAMPRAQGEAERARAWGGLARPWVLAWESCPDAGWMLEALRHRVDPRTLVLAVSAVAADALARVPEELQGSLGGARAALGTVRRWIAGAAGRDELGAARAAAQADEDALRARGYAAQDDGDEDRGDECFSAGCAACAVRALADLAQPGRTEAGTVDLLRTFMDEATFYHPPRLAAAADAVRRALPTADLVLALIAGPRARRAAGRGR